MNTMDAISLKLPEKLLKESGRYARALGLSRAAYLRQAIANMNREARSRILAEEMKRESRLVRSDSLRVNREFAALEHPFDDD
ncbi:MAG TPA: hypothetical protein VMV27_09540 [Candidatus Binataceae bacterium]|nr:hypothetical protein [Candidatus Binataceae bacterium]